MRYIKILSLLIIVSFLTGACEQLLEPADDNHATFDRIYELPAFAEGVLIEAYTKLPTDGYSFTENATDDAVSNDKFNNYHKMATGQWSALFNPVDEWNNSFSAVIYLNLMLREVDNIEWYPSNEKINELFKMRISGEAYALRGLFYYFLLQAHAGVDENGQLSGVPYIEDYLEPNADFNFAREGFSSCIDKIYADFDRALEILPNDYVNISSTNQLPANLSGYTISDYNTFFGFFNEQRISGNIVKGLKARVALLAASPAFNNNDAALWTKAADYAATALDEIGGIAGMDPNGAVFYKPANVDAIDIDAGKFQKEMLWRTRKTNSRNREKDNFPPSLYGNGKVNPSQNLVDAFSMANGYPITDLVNSGYNPNNPYTNRDPRLKEYILVNGMNFSGQTIFSGVGGGTNAKDSVATSTRTGYYLKKLLREDVNLDPNSLNQKMHYAVHMRYTELFLIYAEAANEAWGSDGKGNHGYSAKEIIAAIRKRAGISQPDNYLASVTDKDKMRELIHNERRLELCFEGFRFWDLRRWKADLNEVVKGAQIAGSNISFVNIEQRLFQDYMHYGPIPEMEVLKFNALTQNQGW